MYGACLLLLVALVAFAPASPIAVLLALGMLWALGPEQRLGAQRPRADRAGQLHHDGKADDGAPERRLGRPNANPDDEEGPWKSGF